MSPRHAVAVTFLGYVATFVAFCVLLPVEPTALELHQIVEREYGTVLDRAQDSDLPGPVQALLLEKNLADLAGSERQMYAQERWLLRALGTFFVGTALALVVIVAVRRAMGMRAASIPTAAGQGLTAPDLAACRDFAARRSR